MKSMLSSILIVLCIVLPFLGCSLPQDSLNSSQQVAQQKRIHQDVNVSLEKLERVMDVQFSPDGTLLAIATDVGILLYNTKTYDNPEILKRHTGKIWSIAFRPDGKLLASAGQDKTVRLWDVNTRQQIKTFGINLFPKVNIVFSPDGKMLASGGRSDGIDNAYLWDADTGKRLRALSEDAVSGRSCPLLVMDVAFSPDGNTIACTGGTIHLWDADLGQYHRMLYDEQMPHLINAVTFSPDGNTIACSGYRVAAVWDVKTEKLIRVLINITSHR